MNDTQTSSAITQTATHTVNRQNNFTFIHRMYIYQKERFPFLQNGFLITAFTFSAAAYSRLCRGEKGFVEPLHFIGGVVTTVLFFFLLRICDEFKDNKDDTRYRPYRPVPRGLIRLRELGWTGAAVIAVQIVLNALLMPSMLIPYFAVIAYMALMTREFFVSAWLKRHPMLYTLSHMVIMPLIDMYTTGLDWLNAHEFAPHGVAIFLIVSYFNGLVIEVGRKIRAPEAEEKGVETYSFFLGPSRASLLWIAATSVTAASAFIACLYSGFGLIGGILLGTVFIMCSMPAISFIIWTKQKHAHMIEIASGLWSSGMYLIVGATPMILNFFSR